MKPPRAILTLWLWPLVSSLATASIPLTPRAGPNGKVDMFGCMQSNDYYIVNFVAYQADAQKPKEGNRAMAPHCQELPRIGSARITLDLLDRDVRRKAVSLKVLGSGSRLILETPLTVAKQGVLTADVDFPAPGRYEVVLYVADADLNIAPEVGALHIPLSVALAAANPPASPTQVLTFVLVTGVSVLGLGLLAPRLLKSQVAS